MSMPALTPALVIRSPSSTKREVTSVMTVGSSSESMLSEAVDRVVRAEHQGLGAADGAAVGREAEGVPAVLGVLLGSGGQHSPGAEGVQLRDAVEEEDADLAPPPVAKAAVTSRGELVQLDLA
jgi:hypothetical protein